MLEIALPKDFTPILPLRYMGRDPDSHCERVEGHTIRKALRFDGEPAILTIAIGKRRATVSSSRRLSKSATAQARDAALRLLGLPFDLEPFESRLLRSRKLAALVASRRGLRVPRTARVFEALLWAVAGQQVNIAFAYKLRRSVVELSGTPIGGMIAHPDPEAVAALDYSDLTKRQFSRRKAEYLIDAARAIAAGALDAESLPALPPDEVRERLVALRGFGEWSAHYVMMRGCGFADCLPIGDTGLATGLQRFFRLESRPDRRETEELMAQFAPYRSLATMHLWMVASGAM